MVEYWKMEIYGNSGFVSPCFGIPSFHFSKIPSFPFKTETRKDPLNEHQ